MIWPFSTIETISEEKNEIITRDIMEKNLKSSGSTLASPTLKGKSVAPLVAVESLVTKPRITIKRLKDKANSRGAIKITIADIKII